MICTIFQNILSKEPHYITVDDALLRIENGNSKALVEKIRNCSDKESAAAMKMQLPSVCFSGKFGKNRTDQELIQHSGFIVLDFDDVENLRERQTEIISNEFIYACWVSPSGKGLKALIRIADGNKHREHFAALRDIFPDADKSGANQSRVCYESFDDDIYTYQDAKIFTTIKESVRIEQKETTLDETEIFKKLLTWLSNKGEAFVTGERNNFIFKLASACCRYGLHQESATNLIQQDFLTGNDFSNKEALTTIRSAYKINSPQFGSASFSKDTLVNTSTKREIKINDDIFDPSKKVEDTTYGEDVLLQAKSIFKTGYPRVNGINLPELDYLYKQKRGELTLLSGIGNYGKTQFKKWYFLMKMVLYDEKFATFSPEDCPPEEYYHDYVEMLLGCECTPSNPNKPSEESYEAAYNWISDHIFYVYPKTLKPTPEYIKEIFLKLIIREKISGCCIDPFNQMSNDYGSHMGRDKYLEAVLGEFGRFAQTNDVYFWIIAHPTKLPKQTDGNYTCPDVFDIQDGSMWNNKMDDILIYHRPLAQTEPMNPLCEFYSKKIRRQKTVGKKGFLLMEYDFKKRRFIINGIDHMENMIKKMGLTFGDDGDRILVPDRATRDRWLPYSDNDSEELPF